MTAGPITEPHLIATCYGSRLHCYGHDIDELWDETCYRACYECKHVFRTPEELLAAHNAVLAEFGCEPDSDADQVRTCPICVHDF